MQQHTVTIVLTLLVVAVARAGLFDDADSVLDLDAKTFPTRLEEQHWAIAFYSASCGHCITYSTTWKQLGDAFVHNPQLVVGAVDCDVNKQLCERFSIQSVPQLLFFDRTKHTFMDKHHVIEEADAKHLVQQLHDLDNRLQPSSVQHIPDSPVVSTDHVPLDAVLQHRPPQRDAIVHDGKTAIRFGLETGVFMGRKVLSRSEYDALVNWLSVLGRSFPGEANRVSLRWLSHQVAQHTEHTLTSRTWDDVLEEWHFAIDTVDTKSVFPVPQAGLSWLSKSPETSSSGSPGTSRWKWKHCGGEVEGAHHGGYSCGLWILLHLITTQTVASGPENVSVAGGHAVPAAPDETASAIYNFINFFFSCEACRVNFLKSNPDPYKLFNKLVDKHDAPRKLMFWLWREHNAVSARLNDERKADEQAARLSENPSERLALLAPYQWRKPFPTETSCTKCHGLAGKPLGWVGLRGEPKEGDELTTTEKQEQPNAMYRDSMDGWDSDVLFKYLVKTYCIGDTEITCPDDASLLVYGMKGGSSGSTTVLLVGVALVAAAALTFAKKATPQRTTGIWRTRKRLSMTV